MALVETGYKLCFRRSQLTVILPSQHSVRVNPKNSVALIFGNKTDNSWLTTSFQLKIDNESIRMAQSVKSLGLMLHLKGPSHTMLLTVEKCDTFLSWPINYCWITG